MKGIQGIKTSKTIFVKAKAKNLMVGRLE